MILNLEDSAYYGLNSVGARIWDLIEEPVLVETICRQIMEEYDVDSNQCLADLLALLQEMEAKKLLETHRHETLV
ncbi:MAG: PqqD family protein [Caldilineaceae bacterium]|nr:PqqD family protein [Caldilineaceae bacterium]